jgi:Txe/YoeB family toxin of toxin-antitoxin system
MGYRLNFSKQAKKDAELLERAGLDKKAKDLLSVIKRNPFEPPYEKLTRELKGCYSRRINKQHRIVYEVYDTTAHILRMWTHYE